MPAGRARGGERVLERLDSYGNDAAGRGKRLDGFRREAAIIGDLEQP